MALIMELWVEFVGDHRGVRVDERNQASHHGCVGRGEDHPILPVMEGGQGALQFHMGSVGASNETAPRPARFPSPVPRPPRPGSPRDVTPAPGGRSWSSCG